MPRFYVILELSRITRSRTAILMFLDSFQRFHKRERKREKKKVTRLYTCTRRGGKGKGEFEKEGGKLVRAGGGQRSDGRKVVENKVIIFFSGRRRAISWTRTRGIDGCFRRSESWREKRLTDEYLKFWRGTSEPDAHELRMNFHPLCCLVSSRVTWLRQAWERERGRLLFFSATLFTLLRESERTPTIEKSYLLCPYEARSWKWNCAKGRGIINKSRVWTNVSTTSIETGIDKWFRDGGERCSIRVIWICLGYGFLVIEEMFETELRHEERNRWILF